MKKGDIFIIDINNQLKGVYFRWGEIEGETETLPAGKYIVLEEKEDTIFTCQIHDFNSFVGLGNKHTYKALKSDLINIRVAENKIRELENMIK